MGSSFTAYRGRGFWSRDASIELWLGLLAEEVRRLESPLDWLSEAAEHWHLEATIGGGGCISARLDTYASTPERAAVVLQVAEQTLARLRERGEILSVAWLNSRGVSVPSTFQKEVPAEVFTRVGEAFIRLLRGEIVWDAATSPVL
jgi:hypothetical protein